MSGRGQLKLAFVIEAIDKATSHLTKINKTIDKLTEPARRVRASFRDLIRESRFDRLGAAVGQVAERIDAVRSKLTSGLFALTAAAGAAAFGFKRVADEVDELGDTAKMLSITTQELQRMGFAAQMNGSSQQEMGDALRFLSKNMTEAVNGSQEMVQWFTRLGIPLERLRKMSVIQVFEAMADKFEAVGDAGQNGAKKIAAMQALLGRSGSALKQVLDLGSAGLRKFYAEADRLGVTLSDETVQAMGDFNDSFDKAKLTLFGALANALKAVAPLLQTVLGRFTEWTAANRELIATRFGQWLDEIVPTLKDLGAGVGALLQVLFGLAGMVNTVVQALGGWKTVAAIVTGVIAGSLIAALGMLTTALIEVATAFLFTPFGWFAAGIAGVVALAVLVYKKWEPIKQFFVDLWDGIVRGLNKVNDLVPTWMKKYTPGGMLFDAAVTAVTPAPSTASAPSAIAAPQAGKTEVGGTLNIKIDQDGRVRSTELQKAPWSPMDLDVSYTGGPLALPF